MLVTTLVVVEVVLAAVEELQLDRLMEQVVQVVEKKDLLEVNHNLIDQGLVEDKQVEVEQKDLLVLDLN